MRDSLSPIANGAKVDFKSGCPGRCDLIGSAPLEIHDGIHLRTLGVALLDCISGLIGTSMTVDSKGMSGLPR